MGRVIEMGSTGNSKKVLQTKRLLAMQLMELLEKKNFKKITINDICQGAMISRSAFYLHFDDKYHLLRYCLEEELEQWKTVSQKGTIDDFLMFTLDSIVEKKNFYYNSLISGATDIEMTDIFVKAFTQFFAAYLAEKQEAGCNLPGPISIVSAYYAGGIVWSNIQWIQNDFNISKEEMATCQKRLLSDLIDSSTEKAM